MFCFLGYHKTIEIEAVSLLQYLQLAFGDKMFSEIQTPSLLNLMRQLVQDYIPKHLIVNGCLTRKELFAIGNTDPAMKPHAEFLKLIQSSIAPNLEIVTKVKNNLATRKEYDKFDEAIEELQLAAAGLDLAATGLRIEFCTKCNKTFDPRIELGKFLPAVRNSLQAMRLNEEAGFFLLSTPKE